MKDVERDLSLPRSLMKLPEKKKVDNFVSIIMLMKESKFKTIRLSNPN